VLLSGETIYIVRRKKIFETGKVEEISFKQTYAYGVLINQNCSYSDRKCKDGRNYGGHSDNLNAKFESHTTKKINDKLGYFLYTYKRQMESFTPVVEKVFAEGYIYPMIKEDRDLKVRVTNLVSFGNLQDAQHKIPQQDFPERHGYVNTVRHFKPGYYYTSVIKPMEDCDPFVMYHHESIDPRKLMDQILLMCDDYEEFNPSVCNTINRYDWCQWESTNSDKEDDDYCYYDYEMLCEEVKKARQQKWKEKMAFQNTIYFCPTRSSGLLKKAAKHNRKIQSDVIAELSGYHDKEDNVFALGTSVSEMNNADWIYGRVFKDKESCQNFALVVHLGLHSLFYEGGVPDFLKKLCPHKKFTSVRKTKLKFDITDFQK